MRERKPVDPALRRYLDELAAAAGPPSPMTEAERVQARRAMILKALESRTSFPGLPNNVESHDVAITEALPARLYIPKGIPAPLPVLVYLHGGGWIVGSLATHDPFCRLLSKAARVIILSVDYRRAPENRYPAALEDSHTALRWAAKNAANWGGDADGLAIGGDSAGGNLAAVTANQVSGQPGSPTLRAVLLLYPVLDHPSANYPSYQQNATGYGLEANLMRWFWDSYAPGISPSDPGVSPMQVNPVPKLPPTLVTTAEYDVLRGEGIAYADKLGSAGVAVKHLHSPDMHHNFPVHPGTIVRFPQSVSAFNEIAGWLNTTLGSR